MIGLDTNVLVRYLVQDEPDQALRASRLLESLDDQNQGFVSTVTTVELHWVLCRSYKLGRDRSREILESLLETRELAFQEPDVLRRALAMTTGSIDFPDAVIAELGRRAGCDYTATFDRRAARLQDVRELDSSPHAEDPERA